MDKVKCEKCGTELDKYNDCPIHCHVCNDSICPDCHHPLNGDFVDYCGCNCDKCGWSHCNMCQ